MIVYRLEQLACKHSIAKAKIHWRFERKSACTQGSKTFRRVMSEFMKLINMKSAMPPCKNFHAGVIVEPLEVRRAWKGHHPVQELDALSLRTSGLKEGILALENLYGLLEAPSYHVAWRTLELSLQNTILIIFAEKLIAGRACWASGR